MFNILQKSNKSFRPESALEYWYVQPVNPSYEVELSISQPDVGAFVIEETIQDIISFQDVEKSQLNFDW